MKLKKETVKFLKDNPAGKLDELPKELRELFQKQFEAADKIISEKNKKHE